MSPDPPPFDQVPPNNFTLGPTLSLSATAPGTATMTVTTTLTWAPSYQGDPSLPPPTVGVIETGSASSSIYWVNPTGVKQPADDGFRDSPVSQTPPLYGASSSGSHFTSVSVPAGAKSVTLPNTRTVTATLTCTSNQGGNGSGGFTLTYSATPVTVNLSGQNFSNQALTGQQIKATLTGIPTTAKITSYAWSFIGGTKGNPIKNWDGTNNTVQLVPFASSDLSQTDTTGNGLSGVSPLYFYDQVADTITVVCTVNLKYPDGTTGTVTPQSDKVTVAKPMVAWTVNKAFNNIIPGFYRNYPNQQFGAREPWGPITITEPAALVTGGSGTGCVVQIANLSRGFVRTPQNSKPATFSKIQIVNGNGTSGMAASPTRLDVQFPYPFGFVKNADGTFTASQNTYTWTANADGYAVDVPTASFTLSINDGGGSQWYSSTANDNFNTWVMYRPPANGLGTIYVPLQTLNWGWGGNASLSSGIWSVSAGSPFVPGTPNTTAIPPSWGLYIPYGFSIGP